MAINSEFDPEAVLADAEERERRALADVEFQRRKAQVCFFRNLVHESAGGYGRPVKHSPHVQNILRLLKRRERGEE